MVPSCSYPIAFEVAGPMGMFSDISSGGDGYSYPVPTPSACCGMISAIDNCHGVFIDVVAVGICNHPQWTPYSFSTKSPIRKYSQITKDDPYVGHESILSNPRFQILATLSNAPHWKDTKSARISTNPAHLMQFQFFRRLKSGKSFHPVSLGRKEMLATYVGACKTPILTTYNRTIPVMSTPYFDPHGAIQRLFLRNVEIKFGIVHYSPKTPIGIANGNLVFENEYLQNSLSKMQSRFPC